jgi:cytochrome b6-f complex iron-sulfur subunit
MSLKMDRKTFIRHSCLFGGSALLGIAFLESCQKNSTTPANTNVNFTLDLTSPANSALNTIGGYLQHDTVIVIKTGNSTYVALSNVCTHAGCTVAYNSGSSNLRCPCHGGTFDTNGNVTGGPPPSSLTKLKTSLNGNILTVTS